MMPSTVCFGARDDSYGFSRTSKAGNIITFKLTYKSGYVTCHSSNPSYQSKWGCLQNRLIPNQMATLITDKNRNLLLPKSDFLSERTLRSSFQHLLATPKARLKTCGERTVAVAGPGPWNSIPLELRSSSSIDISKRHFKTYLFKQASNSFQFYQLINMFIYSEFF